MNPIHTAGQTEATNPSNQMDIFQVSFERSATEIASAALALPSFSAENDSLHCTAPLHFRDMRVPSYRLH